MRASALMTGLVAAALLAGGGAWAQGKPTYLKAPMPKLGGEAPAAAAPGGFDPAPVPRDVAPPRKEALKPGEPEFNASLGPRTPQVRTGAGYAPGSAFSEDLQRRNRGGLGTAIAPSVGFKLEN